MKLICISALIFLFSVVSFAQPQQVKPSWVTLVENTIKQKERNLKIENTEQREKRGGYSFVIEFNDFRSGIQITKYGEQDRSPEILFANDIKTYSKTFGKNSKKGSLENFGDESYIWANINNRGETRIMFRKGKIFVNVFASSETLARRLAGYVVEKMP